MAQADKASPARRIPSARVPALCPRHPVARRSSPAGDPARRALRPALRRLDGLSGAARRPDGQRVHSDRRARHLGAEAVRRLDDSREQHRPDHRLGRRVGGRGRRLHHSGAASSWRARPGLLQLLPDHDARLCRRHPRRADDGAAAPGADRQGARRASLSGRHRVRGRARRRRTRRRAGQDGVHGARRRRVLEGAVLDRAGLPDRRSDDRCREPACSRTRR